MDTLRRLPRPLAGLLVVCCLGSAAVIIASMAGGQQDSVHKIAREDVDACLACHSLEMEGKPPVQTAALRSGPHRDLKCQDCHTTIDGAPHTPEMLKEKASCGTCHAEAAEGLALSAHSRPSRVPGDHPTCAGCHAPGGDPHAVTKPGWTRTSLVNLCSNCHAQKDRMQRYGVDPDAVHSYEESFHGKAILRFGMTRAAICTDCHKHHDVLSPSNPAAPTHRNNAAATCSQQGCHMGAQVNFAMSGANHLRLKVKQSLPLQLESLFFQWLTIGTILFLLGGVALDLRLKVLRRDYVPAAGRLVGLLVSLSFLLLVVALAMAFFGMQHSVWPALGAVVLTALAFLFYFVGPRRQRAAAKAEPRYQRFTAAQRWQHGLLAISFTLLVVTGMPLRFAGVDWMRSIILAMGGLDVSRITHRVAAVIMIFTWIWHTIYLLVRWKRAGFTLQSMTMLPTVKDLRDFVDVSKYYLGFSKEEPKYDRFQFKEKFDYFAVYWGMPIMVFSGLVLWFPIYFGNRLPEIGLSAAYIAHSDEAILAFLAITLWHFYNTHFNPDRFPMNPSFYTGTLSRSEMEREHPLELERLEAALATAEGPAAVPQPEAAQATSAATAAPADAALEPSEGEAEKTASEDSGDEGKEEERQPPRES